MQRCLGLRTEGGQHIAQVNRVFGVPVEIWTRGKTWGGNSVNHRPVSKNRKIEGRTVKRDKLRRERRDFLHERRDQLLFGSLSDVGCPERIYGSMTAFFTMGNQRSDTSIPSSPQVRF
jgi:hypothetical protein